MVINWYTSEIKLFMQPSSFVEDDAYRRGNPRPRLLWRKPESVLVMGGGLGGK